MQVEQPWAVLVTDAEEIGVTLGDQQQRRIALALEKRIGRDRRAHAHGVDEAGRDRFARRQAEQVADALHRGVAVPLRVFREHLVAEYFPVRPSRDDVGERATAVDPELPHSGAFDTVLARRRIWSV